LQLPLTPEQHFKAGLLAANEACTAKYGKPFDQIPAADANAFLTDLAGGKVANPRLSLAEWFNALVYPLFTQACFADPIYGGNNDKVFWKMIGYPGLPATYTIDMVEYRGKPFPGSKDPKSIVDFS
jgi:gluconate 2-dehydrogenase gamma chain